MEWPNDETRTITRAHLRHAMWQCQRWYSREEISYDCQQFMDELWDWLKHEPARTDASGQYVFEPDKVTP